MKYRYIYGSIIGKYISYAVLFVSMVIMARLYSPETLGLYAAISSVLGFMQLIAEGGIAPVIINIHNVSKKIISELFAITTIASIILSAIHLLLYDQIIYHLNQNQLSSIKWQTTILIIITTLNVFPNCILILNKKYKEIAYYIAIGEFISLVYVILFNNANLESVIQKSIIGQLTTLILNLLSIKSEIPNPKDFNLNFRELRSIRIGLLYQLSFNIINYFSRNSDNLMIGKYIGAEYLGLYDKAYKIMKYPLLLVTFSLTQALQPTIREIKENKKRVDFYEDILIKITILSCTLSLIIYTFSDQLIKFAFGEKWLRSSEFLRILILSIPIQSILSTTGSIYHSLNNHKQLFINGCITTSLNILAMIIGLISDGIHGICWSLVISFAANLVGTVLHLKKLGFNIINIHFLKNIFAILAIFYLMIYCSR